ncbi:MAG: XRE family transcriptional regulator [Alphaproteobacteria bacterium]|nr:XRE family transcriptional regulator [Alphaproteobacteria bacterium]
MAGGTDVAADDPEAIGATLRVLRKSRGLTLQEVATALGRSVGWLSQIERGVSEPAIRDLRKMAAFFNLPVGFFFANHAASEEERGWIVRASARRPLGNNEEGLVEELLSPDIGGSFELVRSVFMPGAALPEASQRETEEAGYVVSGTLDLEIAGEWFTLEPGDSFRFRNEPFRWRNAGAEPVVVIWAIAPPIY